MLTTFLLIHVCCAAIAMLSGYAAMVFRKGSGLHGAAGTVFFVSLLIASAAGACIAGFLRPNNANLMGSTITFYLVATGWVAIKRRDPKTGVFDIGALLLALALGTAGWAWGIAAANSATGMRDRYPAGFYFVFGTIALLFAASDIRMIVRGGFVGAKRIARHLVRMCLALLFATFSFYPGQAKFFSRAIRQSNVLHVPAVLLAGAMLLWLYRVSSRRHREATLRRIT